MVIEKVTARPSPFINSITLQVSSKLNQFVIVRMFDGRGRIVKMFSWLLVKGVNFTVINGVNGLGAGRYFLEVLEPEGRLLNSMQLVKA